MHQKKVYVLEYGSGASLVKGIDIRRTTIKGERDKSEGSEHTKNLQTDLKLSVNYNKRRDACM